MYRVIKIAIYVCVYKYIFTSFRLVLQIYGQSNTSSHTFCNFDSIVSHLNSTPLQVNTLLAGILAFFSFSISPVNGEKLTLENLCKSAHKSVAYTFVMYR